jgi:FkbM family methyltransferase
MRLSTADKLRIARVLRWLVTSSRALIGRRGTEVVCTRRGVRWSLSLDEGVQLAIYLGVYEPHTATTLRALCPRDGVALDVGANVGAQALPLAATLDSGFVIAVEPADSAFARLQQNASLNPALARRIRPVHRALVSSGTRGAQRYFAAWPLTGAGETHAVHGGAALSSSAAASTLDALVDELRLTRLDVVKLDVDGHEIAVLQGATATLRRFMPAIVFELAPHCLEENGERPDMLLDMLERHGYVLYDERRLDVPLAARESWLPQVPHDGGINLVAKVRPM